MLYINVGTYDGQLLGFKSSKTEIDFQTLYAFGASQVEKNKISFLLKGIIKSMYQSGKYLCIGGQEELVKVYDQKRKKELQILESHEGTVNSIVGYGQFALSGADDGAICVWKIKDWALVHKFEQPKTKTISMCLHPSAKENLLEEILIQQRNIIITSAEDIYQGVFYGENDFIVLMSDRRILYVDCETNRVCHSVDFENGLTCLLQVQDIVAVSDQKGYVYFVRLDMIVLQFKAHDVRIKDMKILEDMLITISSNGEIKAWNCLEFLSRDVEETVDLGDKIKPITNIKTGHRLTCLSVGVIQEDLKKSQQTENVEQINEQKQTKPIKKKIKKVKKQQSKKI